MSDSPAPRPRWPRPVIGAVVVLAAASTFFIARYKSGSTRDKDGAAAHGAQVSGLPGHTKPTKLTVPPDPPEPAVIVDVHNPARVRDALATNAWVQEALKAPLGKGFLGSWSAFLGTKGSELGGAFQGTVFDLFATQLLATPFRVVWFGGDTAPVTPAVVVPKLPEVAKSAFDTLNVIAQRGVFEASNCPVKKDQPERKADIHISRWLIADHPVFGGMLDGRLVMGRTPQAVLSGMCAQLDEPKTTPGADIDVSLRTHGLGRETELMTQLLGLGPTPQLAFAVEGDHLTPKGIAAEVAAEGRLDGAPLSDKLLKLVPEDAPVLFAFQVKLPKDISAEALQKHFASKKPTGSLKTRQVVMLWNPRGAGGPSDTALIWSEPSDQEALSQAFKGSWEEVCGLPVYASEGTLLPRIRSACTGKQPSVLHAAPAVVAGLHEPTSISLGMNVGKLLSQLTADAYIAEAGHKAAPPPEIDEAQRLLEALPFLGLRGLLKGSALEPGGFRS